MEERRCVFISRIDGDIIEVTGESKGEVEISDVDPAGKFIQLLNKGSKELSLGGWTLKHQAGDKDTTFKFHRSVKIEAKGNVTVWSADAGQTHEPPQNIVMKTKWFIGDICNTALVNSEGEEIATRQRQRVHLSMHREEGEDDIDASELQREQCAIM